jgi:hypothetical protein
MTKKTRRSPKTVTTAATNARPTAPRGRQRQRTKKQIALSLLERSKGASIVEMQGALGWQAHSVRGFLAGTVRKMPGVTLVSDKTDTSGLRRPIGEAHRPRPGRTRPATSTGCPNRAGPGRRGQPLSHRRRSQGGLTS